MLDSLVCCETPLVRHNSIYCRTLSDVQVNIESSLASLIFPNNEWQIADAYSEPCETSKMECLAKKVNDF